ncbi:MAG: glycogen/starch/alpha-glucan phosphorylase, partial [bacterium]|nr:glycogen/starch/alpha-glucan phosphorylase [bacterium]
DGKTGGPDNWVDWSMIFGVPHDMPVVGYGGRTVNWLRLYSAETSGELDVNLFNSGDYLRAFERKLTTERISKLLYPSNESEAGRELRLLQEYFFSTCAVRDLMRRFFDEVGEIDLIPSRIAIQLNDTHPALAVPEMIRLLVDDRGLDFDHAVQITRATISYTNHTLLPEALERYPRPLLERVVPRHLQIIELLNERMLEDVRRQFPDDVERLRRMSLVEESYPQRIRMANLAIAGSHHVNGVSKLHSDLVKSRLVPDFVEHAAAEFVNVTNGISPRRWLAQSNPGLSDLITRHIGSRWVHHLDELEKLEPILEDPDFRDAFHQVKRVNKQRLAQVVRDTTGTKLDPDSLFDVQVKRIHLYKRQLLAALHAIHLYLRIVEEGEELQTSRSCLFAGKAAPSYFHAKLVIRLLNAIGHTVAADPRAAEQLRVVFIPDYRVSLAEIIIPAADVSEQISTAGFEASGTGNMKMALNGALTVGTLDGANVEIRDAVGEENIYIFGLQAEEVPGVRVDYDPRAYVTASPRLRRVIDAIADDRFSPDTPGVFAPLLRHLFDDHDPYCVLADFDSYVETQSRVAEDFRDPEAWSVRAGRNTARMGRFSSDRAIEEYAEHIWGLRPLLS